MGWLEANCSDGPPFNKNHLQTENDAALESPFLQLRGVGALCKALEIIFKRRTMQRWKGRFCSFRQMGRDKQRRSKK